MIQVEKKLKEMIKKGKIEELKNEIKSDMNHCLSDYVKKDEIQNTIQFENYNLSLSEIIQLEEWTNKKCSEVLFDSNKDNWSQNTSVFDDRVHGKNQLIFVVEDTNNNKFGGYIGSTINQLGWTTDSNAFVFSLKSNGRLKKMMKF